MSTSTPDDAVSPSPQSPSRVDAPPELAGLRNTFDRIEMLLSEGQSILYEDNEKSPPSQRRGVNNTADQKLHVAARERDGVYRQMEALGGGDVNIRQATHARRTAAPGGRAGTTFWGDAQLSKTPKPIPRGMHEPGSDFEDISIDEIRQRIRKELEEHYFRELRVQRTRTGATP